MNYFKKPWVLAVLGIVIVIAVFLVFSGKSKSPFETARVVRGSVSEEVSVTGKVKPAKNVDLAFEKSVPHWHGQCPLAIAFISANR